MWRSEGASANYFAVREVGKGINFGDSDFFFGGQIGEEIGGGASEQGFAGARRAGN